MAKLSFAETLSAAIGNQPLTLERISAKLRQVGTPTSVTTLSSWKTGRSQPTRQRSLASLRELDSILGLEPGTLQEAAEEDPLWNLDAVVPSWTTAQELAEQMQIDLNRTWRKVHMQDRVVIDEEGKAAKHIVSAVLRAELDEAQIWPFFISQETTVPGSCASVMPRIGLELIEVKSAPEEHLTVGAFALPQPLLRGASANVAFEITWGPQSERSLNMQRAVPDDITSLVIEVEFTGVMPKTLRRTKRDNPDDEPCYFDDVVVSDRIASIALVEPGAGNHGIAWDW
ncbi:MAG: hypothetical protein ACRCWS_07815 [Propionibacteriaceae bacterium]